MRVLLTLYVFMKSSERSRLYVVMVTIRFGDVFLLDAIKKISVNILFSSGSTLTLGGKGKERLSNFR